VFALRGYTGWGIASPPDHHAILATAIVEQPLYPDHYYNDGIHVITSQTPKCPAGTLNMMIKRGANYAVLKAALQEAHKAGAHDAIMLTESGWVSEATVENVFWFSEDTLCTPAVDPQTNCLPGITRAAVLRLASEQGVPIREELFKVHELETADEIFLTGTSAGILPVRQFNDRVVGAGHIGPRTNRLRMAYEQALESLCESI
jgi:branched-chain amino acid aminotransferase